MTGVREGDKIYHDKEWLQEQFESGKILTEIADEAGVSHKTIEKWANKKNVDYSPENRKPAGDGRYRDKEWLQEMHDKYDDQTEIAEECGASLSTINKWATIHDIDYEGRHERQRNPDADWRMTAEWENVREEAYQRDDHTCQWCSATNCEVHAHHITPVEEGGAKYDLDNLVTLCKECHFEHHGIGVGQ